MLNKKLTEKNRLSLYKQIYKYDENLSEKIKEADEGYFCNVLSKEDFWKLCKLCNWYNIKIQ